MAAINKKHILGFIKNDSLHLIKSIQGERGNGISSVREIESTVDGGSNIIILIDNDGIEHRLIVRNGRTGAQGIAAVYDPNNPNTPLFTLDTQPGDSNVNGMTQKGITEFVNGRFVKVDSEEEMEAMIETGPNVENGYDPDVFYYTEEE